jgi:hypothetical protein
MARQNELIAQQGLIYNSRYYDPSLSLAQPFARAERVIDYNNRRRRANKAAAEAKVSQYVENLAGDLPDISKISPKYRNKINEFLVSKRREYTNATKVIGRFAPGTTAYMEAVSKMNSISDSFKNLSDQFDLFKKLKTEELPDFQNRLLSEANNPNNISLMSSILTDELDIEIGEGGNLNFVQQVQDELGNISLSQTSLNDLPKYFNKDFETATKIIEMNKTLYNGAKKMTPAMAKFVEMQLRNHMMQGGRETVLSLAVDDFIIPDGLGLDDDLLFNEERHDELVDVVVDQYLNMLRQSANTGYEAQRAASIQSIKDRKAASGGGSGDDEEKETDLFTPGQRQDIILNQPFAQRIKTRAKDMFDTINDPSMLANFDGRFNELADFYIKTVGMNSPDMANRYISRNRHYEMWKEQHKDVPDFDVQGEYNKRFGAGDRIFVNLTGQGRDLGNVFQYQAVDPFVNAGDFDQFYRDLLITSGMDPKTANYFVYGIEGMTGGDDAASDEGVLDVPN